MPHFAGLTQQERHVIDGLYEFIDARGYPPTVRTLARAIQLQPVTVGRHLRSLASHGLVATTGSGTTLAYTPVRQHSEQLPSPSQSEAALYALTGYGRAAAVLGAAPAAVESFLSASRNLVHSVASKSTGDQPQARGAGSAQAPPDDPGERDRRVTEWLSRSAASVPQARAEWNSAGAAWLRTGPHFAAVAVPAELVHGVIGTDDPDTLAKKLGKALGQTPVLFTRDARPWYTALMPPSVQATWKAPQTTCTAYGDPLWVPVPGGGPSDGSTRWVVPMSKPGALGSPALLESLIAVAHQRAPRRKGSPHGYT